MTGPYRPNLTVYSLGSKALKYESLETQGIQSITPYCYVRASAMVAPAFLDGTLKVLQQEIFRDSTKA